MNPCLSPADSEGVAAQGGGSHRGATQATLEAERSCMCAMLYYVAGKQLT